MAHYAIYVPGLRDHRPYGQHVGIQLWRLFGVRPVYFALGWETKEGFEKKSARLLQKIVELTSVGHSVSLVGVSAGASAALNVFAVSDDVESVVCICGKINHPETVQNHTFAANPDFKESLHLLRGSLPTVSAEKRRRIMSIHPWKDQTVPVKDTLIKGAKEKTVPGWNHVTGIFSSILLGSFSIARFIRSGKRV